MFERLRRSAAGRGGGGGHRHSSAHTTSSTVDQVRMLFDEAPGHYGLLVTLDNTIATGTDDEENGFLSLQLVPDQALPDIHPHGHGPARLEGVQLLKGGGSGVRVFGGNHTALGELVMKHGSEKDLRESLALATISRELSRRGRDHGETACQELQRRIPVFRAIYLAPQHGTHPPKECTNLWRHWNSRSYSSSHGGSKKYNLEWDDSLSGQSRRFARHGSMWRRWSTASKTDDASNATTTTTTEASHSSMDESLFGRPIRLYQSIPDNSNKNNEYNGRNRQQSIDTCDTCSVVSMTREPHEVRIVLRGEIHPNSSTGNDYAIYYGSTHSDGYDSLKAFAEALSYIQSKRGWKVTLAQKTIGGPQPRTAASHLADGTLCGPLLDHLLDEYIAVVRHMQRLTHPSEVDIVEHVLKELRSVEKDHCKLPFDISSDTDAFVGFAMKKNWHPETGRFFTLRRMGKAFRSETLNLTEEEILPARLLGILLKQAPRMNEIFLDVPARNNALETRGYKVDSWRDLLRSALNLKSPVARERLWNCGVTDGGIHNLFISIDGPLYLFDMGEPKLLPLPALLTKFLFSFFHTLGMVDDKEKGHGWENRFEPVQESNGKTRLTLTAKTKELLPKAYLAFKVTLNRLINDFFVEEDHIPARKLLLNYVTLQLLSDAAFCLERWTEKGGGRSRKTNHHKYIEEWLWRSIWDVYVASDLNASKNVDFLGLRKKPSWTRLSADK